MQLNSNNREEDCCVLTLEGEQHRRRRRHRSLRSSDVVRSTEPNLALQKKNKRTAHTKKEAGWCVLLHLTVAPLQS
jgi:hypothetical protein